jgi:hypothetical protein
MAQVTNQPARTARQRYVRRCILEIQDAKRELKRASTGNLRARYSYNQAAEIIGDYLGRSVATVKIWASIDKRDIPDDELEKLKTFMRTYYGQTVAS